MTRSSSASTVGAQAQSTQRQLAVVFRVAVMLALATGLGFGFGAVVERLTTVDLAAGAPAAVAPDRQPDGRLPSAVVYVYDTSAALGSQGEIGPAE
jgi:hypothetical protein